MFSNLLKHVIEKPRPVKCHKFHFHQDSKQHKYLFLCSTTYFRFPFSGKRNSAIRSQSVVARTQTSSNPFLSELRSSLANKLPGNRYFGKFHICGTIAYYKTSGKIVFRIIQILRQHSGTRFAGGRIIFRKTTVYQNLIKSNPPLPMF